MKVAWMWKSGMRSEPGMSEATENALLSGTGRPLAMTHFQRAPQAPVEMNIGRLSDLEKIRPHPPAQLEPFGVP